MSPSPRLRCGMTRIDSAQRMSLVCVRPQQCQQEQAKMQAQWAECTAAQWPCPGLDEARTLMAVVLAR